MLEITAAVALLLNKGLLCFKHWAWHFMNIIFLNFQNSSVRSLYFHFWLGRGWDAQKAVKKLPRASRLASCLRALEHYLMMIVLSKINVTIFESWWRLKIDRLIVWDSATRPKVWVKISPFEYLVWFTSGFWVMCIFAVSSACLFDFSN